MNNDSLSPTGKIAYSLYRISRSFARTIGLSRSHFFRTAIAPIVANLLYSGALRVHEGNTIQGHQMYLPQRNNKYGAPDMLADRYEVGTTRLFNQILQAGMTVIDVGAHVGYFTLLAARLVGPGGRVYAFEPDPSNYSLLRRNIKLNGYQNITAINQAVSDRSGSGTLFLSGMDTGSHSLFPSMPVHGVEEIPVTTLDTFLDREGWPSIHVVKIDVEGSELSVLAGMAGTLQRNANIRLVIEFCPWILRDRLRVEPCDLLATLRSKKFKLSLIRDQDVQQLDSLDVDGLIRRLVKEATYVNLLAESVG